MLVIIALCWYKAMTLIHKTQLLHFMISGVFTVFTVILVTCVPFSSVACFVATVSCFFMLQALSFILLLMSHDIQLPTIKDIYLPPKWNILNIAQNYTPNMDILSDYLGDSISEWDWHHSYSFINCILFISLWFAAIVAYICYMGIYIAFIVGWCAIMVGWFVVGILMQSMMIIHISRVWQFWARIWDSDSDLWVHNDNPKLIHVKDMNKALIVNTLSSFILLICQIVNSSETGNWELLALSCVIITLFYFISNVVRFTMSISENGMESLTETPLRFFGYFEYTSQGERMIGINASICTEKMLGLNRFIYQRVLPRLESRAYDDHWYYMFISPQLREKYRTVHSNLTAILDERYGLKNHDPRGNVRKMIMIRERNFMTIGIHELNELEINGHSLFHLSQDMRYFTRIDRIRLNQILEQLRVRVENNLYDNQI